MRNASLVRLAVFGLVVGAVLIVVFARWRGDRSEPGATDADRVTAPGPRRSARVWYVNRGPLVCVLAPLYRERRRADHERAWLARTLGHDPARAGYLYLHLFHRGGGGPIPFDPTDTGVRLEIDNTWSAPNRSLGAEVAERVESGKVSATGAIFLESLAPAGPIEIPPNGITRILLAFDRPDPWARLAGARIRFGANDELVFRSASVADAVWESLLGGGPIPAALAPDPRLEASLEESK